MLLSEEQNPLMEKMYILKWNVIETKDQVYNPNKNIH